MEIKSELYQSIETGLIDFNALSNEYLRPQLIINNYKKGTKVISHISQEFKETEEFLFSVAFITKGGLATMKQQLIDLQARGIKGRILASDYLNFTDPDALIELQKFTNLEVRVIQNMNFHAKGYIFKKRDNYSIIIGSSNLTQAALTHNNEWNLKITSLENGELVKETLEEYEYAWGKSTIVTDEWINKYREIYKVQKRFSREESIEFERQSNITPNVMQRDALAAIQEIRDKGEKRALVVSATGTGKTYLAAFDLKENNPNRYLFIVHREQIIDKAIESYVKAAHINRNDIGKMVGGKFESDKKYIFASIQTLSQKGVYSGFTKDYFDYIAIDEVHRAAATSYLKVMNYFTPKFMLGLTATPERTDGQNIYELFDYNLAYEIRLQQALEEGMLAPFHYYGISDIEIHGKIVDENTTFKELTSDARVNYIISKLDVYGHSGNKAHGLIFCSKVEEAVELSNVFNEKGYKTMALTGKNTQQERERAVESLESDDGLDYIFTVDIFNEGIDIPKVNQVIMLRATESSIIFIQQLGRGLRKSEGKEYVVVIDFIGNYKKNFIIPIALSGDKSLNKNVLKKYVMTGSSILPGASTINFDVISAEKIFSAITQVKFSTKKMIKENYIELRNKTLNAPKLIDFIKYNAVDPQVIFETYNYYEELLIEMKDCEYTFSEVEKQMLTFISKELSNGKRLLELDLIKTLMQNGSCSFTEFNKLHGNKISDEDWHSLKRVLNLEFFVASDRKKYGTESYVVEKDGHIEFAERIREILKHGKFRQFVEDLLEYSFEESKKYVNKYRETNFVLNEQYSRKDVCRLLNWDKDEKGTIYGGTIKHGTFPIFVTYDKSDFGSEQQKYGDRFINRSRLLWQSQVDRGIDSKIVKAILNYKEVPIHFHLFVQKRKQKNGPNTFSYLGNVLPDLSSIRELLRERLGTKVTEMEYQLDVPVRPDLFEYLTTKIKDEE